MTTSKILLLTAMTAVIGSTEAARATTVITVGNFVQVAPKKGAVPKIVSYKNEDKIKTTAVNVKTPIYAPTYDRNHVINGQKITGYTTVVNKSTLVTPKSELYTNSGTSTTFSTPVVNFNYDVPVAAQFAPFVTGPQAAYFSLDAISTTAPVEGASFYFQTFQSGTISFTRTAAVQLYTPTGKKNGGALTNLLTISFTNAVLVTRPSGTVLNLLASTPMASMTMTSDFLNFSNAVDYDFAIALTAANPSVSLASIDPTLTNVTGQRTFNTTRASASGGFGASSVPEPATWTLMALGFGTMGLRRRKLQNVLV